MTEHSKLRAAILKEFKRIQGSVPRAIETGATCSGFPDILVALPDFRTIFVECKVKSTGDKLSMVQKYTMKALNRGLLRSFVVTKNARDYTISVAYDNLETDDEINESWNAESIPAVVLCLLDRATRLKKEHVM